jgi:hypothetical protein
VQVNVIKDIYFFLGFEVLTAVGTKMAIFWVVAACSLVEVYQRFRGPCCLHHQGERYIFDIYFFEVGNAVNSCL